MWGRREEIEARGARLAFVGSGAPPFARDFEETFVPGALILSDEARDTYRAIGARRGLRASLGPAVIAAGQRARAAGFSQTAIRGDALVQGGVLVVLPGDRVTWSYLSRHAGDHPDPDDVVAALSAAVESAA